MPTSTKKVTNPEVAEKQTVGLFDLLGLVWFVLSETILGVAGFVRMFRVFAIKSEVKQINRLTVPEQEQVKERLSISL